MASQINRIKLQNCIRDVLDKIHTEADPQLLNEYRSVFRKEVPFFSRSYVAAYFLMLQCQGEGGKSRQDGSRQDGGRQDGGRRDGSRQDRKGGKSPVPGPAAESGQNELPRQPLPPALPDDESVRLFVNIGRNRRVFARELLGFIYSQAQVSQDDIGSIRILDNYSFVQVRTSAAAAIIEALNGNTLRGRTLSVDYARPKRSDVRAAEDSSAGFAGDADFDTGAYTDGEDDLAQDGDDYSDKEDI